MKITSFITCIVALLVFCFWNLQPALALNKNIEDRYLLTLQQGNVGAKIVVAKKITQSYIENDNIFTEIEQQLLHHYNNGSDKNHIDQMAWYCKALASSGNTKYLKSVQTVAQDANDSKLQYYAKQSVDLFPFHEKRNRTLSGSSRYLDQGYDANSAQLAVLLQSEDILLKRDAVKKIMRADFADPRLFDLVDRELLLCLNSDNANDKIYIDTMSWMCKALAVSGDRKYITTLQKVESDTVDLKLQRYAEQALDSYR